jgi:hypothetical protein
MTLGLKTRVICVRRDRLAWPTLARSNEPFLGPLVRITVYGICTLWLQGARAEVVCGMDGMGWDGMGMDGHEQRC